VIIVVQRAATSSGGGGMPEGWEDLDILVAMTGCKVGDTWWGILEPRGNLVVLEHGEKEKMKGREASSEAKKRPARWEGSAFSALHYSKNLIGSYRLESLIRRTPDRVRSNMWWPILHNYIRKRQGYTGGLFQAWLL
jgi:hypothetical protein